MLLLKVAEILTLQILHQIVHALNKQLYEVTEILKQILRNVLKNQDIKIVVCGYIFSQFDSQSLK